VLVLAFAGWILRAPLLTAAGAALVENESPRKAQAIVVLGGDDFGTRILKAAQLATAGYAPTVLVSTQPSLVNCDCQTTVSYAVRSGYPASMFQPVLTPTGADSTRSEATFFGRYLKAHDIRDILLVTSNFHTRRAAYLWHKQVPWLQFRVVAAPDRFFTPGSWWKTRNGEKTFFLEWCKTFAARLGD
jgi:uncharacterized SAM-binding protein YcdF (DUF218 family)